MGILSTNHCWLSKWLPTILREEQSVPKHPIRAASALSGSEISGVKCDEGGKVIHHLQSKFKGNSVILNPSIHFPPPLPLPRSVEAVFYTFFLYISFQHMETDPSASSLLSEAESLLNGLVSFFKDLR